MTKLKIGITVGCPDGIGTEVFLKALAEIEPNQHYLVFSPPDLLIKNARILNTPYQQTETGLHINGHFLELYADFKAAQDWQVAPLEFQKEAMLCAISFAQSGTIQALMTGPINKEALQNVNGHSYPGHTELLHSKLGTAPKPLMIFAGGPLLLALATIHLPIKDVADSLNQEGIKQTLELIIDLLRTLNPDNYYPHIAVLGLNPHAGESGILGKEEQTIIEPALEQLSTEAIIDGPLSADGFFAHLQHLDPFPQVVLAMYHDQGLCAYKLLSQGQGVNITWGLQLPRTSPDHGTAYDIAGKGIADERSTLNALRWAETFLLLKQEARSSALGN